MACGRSRAGRWISAARRPTTWQRQSDGNSLLPMTKMPKRRPLFGDGVNPIRQIGNMIADYWQIRASGRFDADHYLAQIKNRGLKHHFPLTHYVISGERKGLDRKSVV